MLLGQREEGPNLLRRPRIDLLDLRGRPLADTPHQLPEPRCRVARDSTLAVEEVEDAANDRERVEDGRGGQALVEAGANETQEVFFGDGRHVLGPEEGNQVISDQALTRPLEARFERWGVGAVPGTDVLIEGEGRRFGLRGVPKPIALESDRGVDLLRERFRTTFVGFGGADFAVPFLAVVMDSEPPRLAVPYDLRRHLGATPSSHVTPAPPEASRSPSQKSAPLLPCSGATPGGTQSGRGRTCRSGCAGGPGGARGGGAPRRPALPRPPALAAPGAQPESKR